MNTCAQGVHLNVQAFVDMREASAEGAGAVGYFCGKCRQWFVVIAEVVPLEEAKLAAEALERLERENT
jgi:hypothetical protein